MTDRNPSYAVATAQIIGDRRRQEDSLAVHEIEADTGVHGGELLLVLADGMGGHAGGDVASRLAVEHFSWAYVQCQADIPESLRSSLDSANEGIANAAATSPELAGMATTLIGCVIHEGRMYWISVGDSPLWVFHDGTLQRINADHSMVPLLDNMVGAGVMSREEAQTDYRRNVLRSGVAGKTIELIDLCKAPCLLNAGDIVILASDGMETLNDDELEATLGNPVNVSLPSLVAELMNQLEASGHPGQDNASIILARH